MAKSKLTKLRNKCDKALQLEGKRRFKYCEVCGRVMDCLHHFYPKESCKRLRYDWDNLIPICVGCHFAHHKRFDPSIHATVIKQRGMEWYEFLTKKKGEIIKVNIGYYKKVLEDMDGFGVERWIRY